MAGSAGGNKRFPPLRTRGLVALERWWFSRVHDGPKEATHHPDGSRVFHFRSSSVKAIQTSLVTAWKQCSEKPKELPLYQLRNESGN